MPSAKERLGQLLALAAERRWTALAREVTALVAEWPHDYPAAKRAPVLALLEVAVRECDDTTRAEIAGKLGGHPELPLHLLNALYLAAPAPLRREILMRNQLEREDAPADAPLDPAPIIAAARNGTRDFTGALSAACAIPRDIAQAILSDASGEPLAVLCRGTGIERAAFSAIALLRGPRGLPLNVFETVPDQAARRLAHQWRTHPVDQPNHAQAAE